MKKLKLKRFEKQEIAQKIGEIKELYQKRYGNVNDNLIIKNDAYIIIAALDDYLYCLDCEHPFDWCKYFGKPGELDV